jgi:hypothetical protein
MRKLLLLFLLLTGGSLWAQNSVSGSITTSASLCSTQAACVSLPVTPQAGSASVQLLGTFSATAQFEGCNKASCDPTSSSDWFSVAATPQAGGTAVTSSTSTGAWRINAAGLTVVRVRASALASGTILVNLSQGAGSASSGSGSGSGTVTSFSSGDLSPLFTTGVATATSTPALSFSLTNAAANTVFGNNTSGSAAPGYQTSINVSGSVAAGTSLTAGTDGGECGSAPGCMGGALSDVALSPTAGYWAMRGKTTGAKFEFQMGAGAAGPLPVNSGGTGLSSFTSHNVLTGGSAGTALGSVAPGTSGNVLTSDGTDWTSAAAAGSGGDTYAQFTFNLNAANFTGAGNYLSPVGNNVGGAGGAPHVAAVVGKTGNLQNFYFRYSVVVPANVTYTMTIYKCNNTTTCDTPATTGVTCQIAAASYACSDTTHTAALTAGDLIILRIDQTGIGTPANSSITSVVHVQ